MTLFHRLRRITADKNNPGSASPYFCPAIEVAEREDPTGGIGKNDSTA
jgi:hypothetical protein